jgi:predicted Ser/Thr protein kinase
MSDHGDADALFDPAADGVAHAADVLDRCRTAPTLRRHLERRLHDVSTSTESCLAPDAHVAVEALAAAERLHGRWGADEEVLAPSECVGRFTVLRRLGEGAMAVVYLAHDEALDRRVALKVLRRGVMLPEGLAREARTLARVAHPNVVQVYETGEHDARPFIAMELVEGHSLRRWLDEAPRSPVEVIRTFVQAGWGLAAAHRAGVAHRDFKPDNVLVGPDGRVRVVDFGIAALTGHPGDVGASTLQGTPAYMAPEQFLGKAPSAASDQFAFCVALYRALFRVAPFAGDDVPSLRGNVMAGDVRPPPTAPAVPAWVRRILMRGLSHAPEERFLAMSDLLHALERRLPGPELDPAVGRRERRFVCAILSAVGLALLLAMATTGASTGAQPSIRQMILIPIGALAFHAAAAIVLRRRLLGNRFARNALAIVWLGGVTVVVHRLLAMRFHQPVAEVLTVDMFVLGMQHVVAALLFDSWFGLTATFFLAGALVASVWSPWAFAAMLASVVASYALAAVRVGM